MAISRKKETVNIEIVADAACGILVDGEFVGSGELLECDEQTAAELIRRGRAKLYDKSDTKKKADK